MYYTVNIRNANIHYKLGVKQNSTNYRSYLSFLMWQHRL